MKYSAFLFSPVHPSLIQKSNLNTGISAISQTSYLSIPLFKASKTRLFDIDNIILLLLKQESLEHDINEINDKIKDLEKKLIDISDEKKQMDEFLKIYHEDKYYENAVKLSDIEKQRIVNWIHEGRDGTNANKIYFFKEFNKIKSEKEHIHRGVELRKLKTKRISQLVTQLRNGKTKVRRVKLLELVLLLFIKGRIMEKTILVMKMLTFIIK